MGIAPKQFCRILFLPDGHQVLALLQYHDEGSDFERLGNYTLTLHSETTRGFDRTEMIRTRFEEIARRTLSELTEQDAMDYVALVQKKQEAAHAEIDETDLD